VKRFNRYRQRIPICTVRREQPEDASFRTGRSAELLRISESACQCSPAKLDTDQVTLRYPSLDNRFGDLMTKKPTRTEAFAEFGIVLKNRAWSLSGISTDGNTVAVSAWVGDLSVEDGKTIYERPNWGDWYDGPGKRFFFEDLLYARDNCDGIVRLVVSSRASEEADIVKAKDVQARPDLKMKLIKFDRIIGSFRLEQVS
jgi:hypothetical protein